MPLKHFSGYPNQNTFEGNTKPLITNGVETQINVECNSF